MNIHAVGETVAWNFADGRKCCGKIRSEAYGVLTIVRVDGGLCTINSNKIGLHEATADEVLEACKAYACEIGGAK